VLIRRAEVDGRLLDVRIRGGRIAALEATLVPETGEPTLDAEGGALLPGLHDHHLHLFALAASATSLRCGPPEVQTRAELARALAGAPPGDWIRGIGYHDSVAGALERGALDALEGTRPLRIQQRSGALWLLNSAAVAALGLDAGADHPGVERDADGRATGRLYRADAWLRERLGPLAPPDLSAVGARLATYGVTGVSDATPTNGAAELAAFTRALARGELRQRLVVMGRPDLPEPSDPGLSRGAVKLVLAENDLPGLDALQGEIESAHAKDRSVAIHCVTRSELLLATAAFAAAGARAGDRIEHASVTPDEALEMLAALPLTVVTQPGFLLERGDAYRREVDARDLPWLYRCRGFLDAGVPLGAGTDAPFGSPDPWLAMQAAVDRRTRCGATLGAGECLSPEQALALFSSAAQAPGGAPRRVAPRQPADLLLLDCPWSRAREHLEHGHVRATLRDGAPIWSRDSG
jgi:predicted amidohydrolase YtcJ